MQDPASGLLRIHLPRTPVNKGKDGCSFYGALDDCPAPLRQPSCAFEAVWVTSPCEEKEE